MPDDWQRMLGVDDVTFLHLPDGDIEGTDSFVPFYTIGDWSHLPTDRSAPIVLGGMIAWEQSGRPLTVDATVASSVTHP